MHFFSLPLITQRTTANLGVLACLAAATAIVAVACGEDEVYTADPIGTIAFTSDRDGNSEIYLMDADGSGQRNVTANEAPDSEPSWSPDGSLLAFTSYRSGPANLFLMNTDDSDVEQLTDSPAVEGGARWSRDGSRIAFYSYRDQSAGLMWVMDAEGSDPEPVLREQLPSPQTRCSGGFPGSWFPDGQRLLFRGSEGEPTRALQVCSTAVDGSDTQVILSEPNVKSIFPSISPDASKIAFTTDRDGNPEIYVMNVDGTALRRLTDNPALDEYPTWSPDGQWIAFHSNREGHLDIYIVRPDGSELRQLTDNPGNDMEPSWSPQ